MGNLVAGRQRVSPKAKSLYSAWKGQILKGQMNFKMLIIIVVVVDK